MTEPTTTETERGTWRDWLPEGTPEPDESELLTRDEVMAHVARLGAVVTDSEFRYWTSLGVLPGPVRQWFRGATRATYPDWMVIVVYAVRQLRRGRWALPEIGKTLHEIMVREGPEKFLEGFIKVVIFGPTADAARHLRLLTGASYNHVEITYTHDGDPNTAVTIDADFLM